MAVYVVLLGAPGAGKGTQAELISKVFNLTHVSTGDLFRENIRENTELGKLASEYTQKGLLVPDSVTIAMVEDRLKKDDCQNGVLLDGPAHDRSGGSSGRDAGKVLQRGCEPCSFH